MRLNWTCHNDPLERNFTSIISRTPHDPVEAKTLSVEPPHRDDLPLSDKNGGWTCLELMLAADFSSQGRVYKEQSDWR